ncbi:ComEC/Rec2 family competence protein [Plantactinospora sp. WMMB334]|uniref:ComEC/Rec2 family competence protein n=1 Tax=Plantactinospora sp. WMMB334 TaxID=3404119 RepID=UPI003B95B518
MSKPPGSSVSPDSTEQVNVEILFLDVGQGDATLVVDHATKEAILIDCPGGREYVVAQALRERACKLALALITHWDLDHFGGIIGVLDQCETKALRFNHETLLAHGKQGRVLATLRRLRDNRYNHIEFSDARQGFVGAVGAVRFELLAPSYRQLLYAVSSFDRNLASGVVAIEANGTRVLVGGDADGRVWSRILSEGTSIRSDALKWPHHGAMRHTERHVDDQQLLEAVEPSLVVFSAGSNNTYGHPLPSTVQLVAQHNIGIVCTQVTERCHFGLHGTDTPCAGTVSLMLSPGGRVTRSPNSVQLASLIDGWTRPLCRPATADPNPTGVAEGEDALVN